MKQSEIQSATTIDDVAKIARVSISTVSRVLNGRDRVHPQTRERVLQAVRDLQYQPSAFAQGLAKQRTQTLGFVIPNISDPFYLEIVRGVEETTTAAGFGLLVASQPRATRDYHSLQLFTQRRVDGLILVGIDLRWSGIDQIVKRGFPIVAVQQDTKAGLPSITVDNYGGARKLAEHLLQHGIRHFAYIAGSNYTPDNAARLAGLRDVLATHGLNLPDSNIAQGDYSAGSGYKAMLQLLDRPQLPEAVFAANDQMAADALLALRSRGLKVPEDLIVVGFDDLPLATYVSPPLTTVHQPTYEMGLLAAQQVLAAIRGETPLAHIVLETKLVVRRSCGCKE